MKPILKEIYKITQKRSNEVAVSLPPRHLKIKFNRPFKSVWIVGRRKTQKIIRSGPKNAATGMCPECMTIGKIFILGQPGKERGKCEKCRHEFEL